MLSLRLSKDMRKRSKAEDKGKKEKKPQKIVQLKWQVCVLSLLIYSGLKLNGRGWESGDKGHKKQEVLTPPLPPPPPTAPKQNESC